MKGKLTGPDKTSSGKLVNLVNPEVLPYLAASVTILTFMGVRIAEKCICSIIVHFKGNVHREILDFVNRNNLLEGETDFGKIG